MWAQGSAYVWAGFATDEEDPYFDWVVKVSGPFADGSFTVVLTYVPNITDQVVQPCDGVVSFYEEDVKTIRASLPSSCMGSPSHFSTAGLTHRDATPASPGSYFYDESEEFTVLAS